MKISFIMTREIVCFCLKYNYAKTSFVNRIFDAKGNKKLPDSKVFTIFMGMHGRIAVQRAFSIYDNHMSFTILNLICAKRNQFPVFRCNSILVNRWIGKMLR